MPGPLSILQTSTTSTAIPLIADNQPVRFRVQEMTYAEPEGERAYGQVKVKLATIDPVPSRDGSTLNPGFPIFQTFNLGTKEDPSKPLDLVKRNICQFMDACLGTGDAGNTKGLPPRPELDTELFPTFIGKEFHAIVKVRESKDPQYGPSNQLNNMQYPASIAA